MFMFLVDRLPKEHSSSADQSLGNCAHVSVSCCVPFLIGCKSCAEFYTEFYLNCIEMTAKPRLFG